MLCENVLFLQILNFFNIAMNIIRFVIPIILIIKLVIDFYHQIYDVNGKDIKEKIMKRVVACIIIFIVPTIINVFFGFIETIMGTNFNYSECSANATSEYIDILIEKQELEDKLAYDKKNEELINQYNELMRKQASLAASNKTALSSLSSFRIGEKYNVTDSQLTNIAKVCQREQGSPSGAAAEAELMINKYILDEYSGTLYDYLFNSPEKNWWHPIKTGDYVNTNLRPEIKEAVRKVVVEGIRTLPPYIDEHDYIGDIKKITTNGVTGDKNNKSDYVQNVTHVHTTYNSGSSINYWVFYCFPNKYENNSTKMGDPFGYTVKAKEKYDSLNK